MYTRIEYINIVSNFRTHQWELETWIINHINLSGVEQSQKIIFHAGLRPKMRAIKIGLIHAGTAKLVVVDVENYATLIKKIFKIKDTALEKDFDSACIVC